MNYSYKDFGINVKKIDDYLNILEYRDDNIILSKTGDLQASFQIELPEIFTCDESQLNAIYSAWSKLIDKIPVNYVLHRQDIFFKNKFVNTEDFKSNKSESFLTNSNYLHFIEREFFNHISYLHVSKISYKAKNNILKIETHPLVEKNLQEAIKEFQETIALILSTLNKPDLRQSLRQLSKEEYFSYLNKYMSLEFSESANSSSENILIDAEGTHIGEKTILAYALNEPYMLPEHIDSHLSEKSLSTSSTSVIKGFLAPIGVQLEADHVINQYIITEDSEKIKNKLKSQHKLARGLSFFSEENALIARDADELLFKMIDSEAKAVSFHLNCLLPSFSKDEELELKQSAIKAFDQMNIEIEQSSLPWLLFLSSIAPNNTLLPKNELFCLTSQEASRLLLHESFASSRSNDFAIRVVDRLHGKPLWLDLHTEPFQKGIIKNHNKFVLGGSGSGKSFFMNHLVRSFYESGGHVFIVDMGSSYISSVEIINSESNGKHGLSFAHTGKHPMSFNPFIVPKGILSPNETEDQRDYENGYCTMILSLLEIAWKESLSKLTVGETKSLRNIIYEYLQHVKQGQWLDQSFTGFHRFAKEKYTSSHPIKIFEKKEFDISTFLDQTEEYCKDKLKGHLLNAEVPMDLLNNRCLMFELEHASPEEFKIITLMIANTFDNKIRSLPKGVPKMIVIEEAWSALATMENYIKYLNKTVRKHGAQTVFVTQEIEDLTSSEIVKNTIVNNSSCKIILDLRELMSNFDEIQKTLSLTEFDKSQILSINRNENKDKDKNRKCREFWVGMGGVISQVYGLEVSKEEYICYSTTGSERDVLKEQIDKCGDITTAIRNLAYLNK